MGWWEAVLKSVNVRLTLGGITASGWRRPLTAGVIVLISASLSVGCGDLRPSDPSETSSSDAATASRPSTTTELPAVPANPPASIALVTRMLEQGSADALERGVTIYAAVSTDGWNRAAQVNGGEQLRMWSTAKAVTATAALTTAAKKGGQPTSELDAAMRDAIQRSENCRQRRVVLWLQEMAGGPADAADAVRSTLASAGIDDVDVPQTAAAPDAECIDYLNASSATNPLGPSLLLGTAKWTAVGASRFSLGLAAGSFGAAGRKVYCLMKLPKQRSREQKDPTAYTAAVDWGAGKAMASLKPAYKSGWGGVEQQSFIAGQIVALRVHDVYYGVAVFGAPVTQPVNDDPGKTEVPAAVENLLELLAPVLAP